MKKESKIYKITKMAIESTFGLGIISLFMVPYIINRWGQVLGYNKDMYLFLSITIILAGIIALYIVWQLHQILKTVVTDNPFTAANLNCLRKIALGCMSIAGIFGIKLFVKFTLPTLVLTIAFGIGTLCFLTLKDLFKQALFYKEESDGVI